MGKRGNGERNMKEAGKITIAVEKIIEQLELSRKKLAYYLQIKQESVSEHDKEAI